jgi:endonuclease/exonuclease/phosphatase family metal-dependent hydrolase
MSGAMDHLRVATYNIHKARGMDRHTSPARIVSVLQDLDADILCLQEVVDAPGHAIYNQAGEIAQGMPDYRVCFGENRPLHGGRYGNMTLTRLSLLRWHNHDITHRREERGVLQTDLELADGHILHVFNVHLGTGHMERRVQAARLLGPDVLGQEDLINPRLVVGDFNEWTRGLTTRMLRRSFQTFRPKHGLRFPRTYPGVLPFLSLDHYYYEPPLELVRARLIRTRKALVASDHLPLIAEFRIAQKDRGSSVGAAVGEEMVL